MEEKRGNMQASEHNPRHEVWGWQYPAEELFSDTPDAGESNECHKIDGIVRKEDYVVGGKISENQTKSTGLAWISLLNGKYSQI